MTGRSPARSGGREVNKVKRLNFVGLQRVSSLAAVLFGAIALLAALPGSTIAASFATDFGFDPSTLDPVDLGAAGFHLRDGLVHLRGDLLVLCDGPIEEVVQLALHLCKLKPLQLVVLVDGQPDILQVSWLARGCLGSHPISRHCARGVAALVSLDRVAFRIPGWMIAKKISTMDQPRSATMHSLYHEYT